MTFFNEFDPYAAAWIRQLMADGQIPAGDVDERSIKDVAAADVVRYRRCHWFAGISGWELALNLAGWPADRPVWTGSAPCQPYSSAGKRQGNADERDLWPDFFRLIRECRPATIFGEQVAAGDVVGTELEASFVAAVQGGDARRANALAEKLAKKNAGQDLATLDPRWIDRLRADLEGEGYTFGFTILGAHSSGADHIRQRVYWVAHLQGEQPRCGLGGAGDGRPQLPVGGHGDALRLGDAEFIGQQARQRDEREATDAGAGPAQHSELRRPVGLLATGGMADAERTGVRGDERGAVGGATGEVSGEVRQQRLRADARASRRRIVFDFSVPDGRSIETLRAQGAFCPSDELIAICGRAREFCRSRGLANTDGRIAGDGGLQPSGEHRQQSEDGGVAAGVAQGDACSTGLSHAELEELQGSRRGEEWRAVAEPSGSFWADSRLILCRDGKCRRIPLEPGLFPLAHGASGGVVVVRPGQESEAPLQAEDIRIANRVGALRGAGNAICVPTAVAFIQAFLRLETEGGLT